ncbi:serine hydrolase domain-containing protein [Pedobacter ginsengisoli]|nr:serine hydrolase domain-containing protein [Pedobacter ginsengisoli]
MNENKPDSVYLLFGEALRKQIPVVRWASIYKKQISGLLPLRDLSLVTWKDSIGIYKVTGKIPLQIMFGNMDKNGKMNTFAAVPSTETAKKMYKVSTDNKLINHLDSTVDKVVSAYIQTKGNVGISTAVFYKRNSYFYNYGERKIGTKSLPDNHTVYDIGSITKTFTSTLLALAVHQQKLTLETSITKFLPDSVAQNQALKNITFKELANHTSGLPRDADNLGSTVIDANQPYGNYRIKDLFSLLRHFKQTTMPGVKYGYSNIGVGLMGVLLERVYQRSYRELLQQYITAPLEMNETVCSIDTTKFNNLAEGYNNFYQPVAFYHLQAVEAAGAIKSSTFDLINYVKAQILTSDPDLDLAIKLTHQVTFDKKPDIVGLGWHYLPDAKNVITHSGGTGGYSSSICIDLNKQIAVVVLTNNTSTGYIVAKDLINLIH